MTTEYKIRMTPRRSMKRGAYLDIVDGETGKPIACIGEKVKYIEEKLPFSQRAEILAIFDNYETLAELYGHSASLLKLKMRITQEMQDAMQEAFKISDALNLDFKPMRAMIRALNKEMKRTFHQAGATFDLPELHEEPPSKHIEGRKIFQELLKIKGQGAVEAYRAIAEQTFNKLPEYIEVKHLHMYAEGKAKPSFWAYSSALEALAVLNQNIFDIKINIDILFELWSMAYLKNGRTKAEVIELFKNRFNPSEDVVEQLKNFLV